MRAENPSPDNETMENLLDTNEQLQTALNQHQRAVLNARKQLHEQQEQEGLEQANGTSWEDGSHSQQDVNGSGSGKGKGKSAEDSYPPPPDPPSGSGMASGSGSSRAYQGEQQPTEDPFADPKDDGYREPAPIKDQLHSQEPFHPGGFKEAPRDVNREAEDDMYDAPKQQ